MRRVLVLLACVAVAVTGALAPATSASAAQQPLPVPYQFLPTAVLGGMPGASAPGTNDWSCRPTAAHPRPVVLVHGTFGNRSTNWQTYGPLLKNNGYCVFALTYGTAADVVPVSLLGGMAPMQDSAAQLGDFVARVLAATGASQVDIVGHSQGTLMPNYYLKFLGGAPYVANYISLSPLWHGTQVAGLTSLAGAFGQPSFQLPLCVACGQFSPASAFITRMRAGGVAVPGVRYVNIMTRYDELVVPYTSGREAGMTNIVLQDRCKLDFTEHFQMAADRNASVHVLNALDPAHPRRVPCVPVLPFTGGLG